MQRGFQFLAGSEMVALQHVFDTTVEALDHAVCLGRSWRRQAVFDVQFGAELVELMGPALRALAQAKETVGELLPSVREYGSDAKGQARSRSRRKRRALAAVLLL